MLQDLQPQRWETTASLQQVASKLGLSYDEQDELMQDWSWQVASPDHLPDYLQLYAFASYDERVVLMEMLLQATTTQEEPAAFERDWHQVKKLLDQHPSLHAWSVHYWCCWGASAAGYFEVTTYLRTWWTAHFILPA